MPKLHITLIVLFCSLFGAQCSGSAEDAKNASVTSIELKFSNPSMGPNERRVSYSLDCKTYKQELTQLLEKTTVNGVMTLGKFLRLLRGRDAKAVESVRNKFKPRELGEGRSIQTLSFTFSDGSQAVLDDLDTYSITGYYYASFETLIKDKGARSVDSPIVPLSPSELSPLTH